jgi:hypothetical protein
LYKQRKDEEENKVEKEFALFLDSSIAASGTSSSSSFNLEEWEPEEKTFDVTLTSRATANLSNPSIVGRSSNKRNSPDMPSSHGSDDDDSDACSRPNKKRSPSVENRSNDRNASLSSEAGGDASDIAAKITFPAEIYKIPVSQEVKDGFEQAPQKKLELRKYYWGIYSRKGKNGSGLDERWFVRPDVQQILTGPVVKKYLAKKEEEAGGMLAPKLKKDNIIALLIEKGRLGVHFFKDEVAANNYMQKNNEVVADSASITGQDSASITGQDSASITGQASSSIRDMSHVPTGLQALLAVV